MANTIVGSVIRLITPQATSSLAWRLGGSSVAVQSGIGTSVAALISGIAQHADDTEYMMQILNLVHDSDTKSILSKLPNITSDISAYIVDEPGFKLAPMLFDGKQAAIEEAIGLRCGLGASSGSQLMAIAAPITAGLLGRRAHDQNLNVYEFSNLIRSEAEKIESILPADVSSLISNASVSSPAWEFITTDGPGKMKREAPLIGLFMLALISWPFFHGCHKPQQPPPAAPVEQAVASAPDNGPLGEFIKRKLPDGTELNIPRLGIENKLIDFIEDSSRPVDKTTWFDFDRLIFDTGSAKLQPSSAEQLQNISAILKAYPKVKAKIGGYTDNTGDKQANLKLSESRATNVMHELVSRSIEASRLEAKGYGEEHPVADNATAEGRQKNRRISLLVTEK